MLLRRSLANPIVSSDSSSSIGTNINGPSLIKVPPWLPQPLGQYYLYFGHHDGRYIRLAVADQIEGPWRIHEPGVLPLNHSGFEGHIASPDVHVDDETQQIRMYFHGCEDPTGTPAPQKTRVATSTDGLAFTAHREDLGESYFRVFFFDGYYYALQMPGLLLRSSDPLTGFKAGPTLFDATMRHSAVAVHETRLTVLFTQVGDAPESILKATIDLHGDWFDWRTSEISVVLQPEHDYEGGHLPQAPSTRGLVETPVNQLRDPAIFIDNEDAWLVYTLAGESGLGLAQIEEW